MSFQVLCGLALCDAPHKREHAKSKCISSLIEGESLRKSKVGATMKLPAWRSNDGLS